MERYTPAPDGSQKVILLLQDRTGTFFRALYNEIKAQGHVPLHINLCPGDYFFWLGKKCLNYRGTLNNWPDYLSRVIRQNGVTDMIYHQDRFCYHAAAMKVARKLGVRCYVCESGYLRPDWLTLEQNGMAALSHFPDDPAHIQQAARGLPAVETGTSYPCPFVTLARRAVTYNLLNVLFKPFFPFFSNDAYYHPLVEYWYMIPRLFKARVYARAADRVIQQLIEHQVSYYFFPLQIQSDYQIRYNAPYRHISEAIEETLASFSAHAPGQCHLVFKVHPMDCGIERWDRVIHSLAQAYQVDNRVQVLQSGNLETLISHAKGCVLINSTVGIQSIAKDCPTKVLGTALYDIQGLTARNTLDHFWSHPPKPDQQLYDAFERLLAASIQLKGNFHTRAGKKAAVEVIARRVITEQVNKPDAFVPIPPRVNDTCQ